MEDDYEVAELDWYTFSREMKEEEEKMEIREQHIRQEEERCEKMRHIRKMRDLEETIYQSQANNLAEIIRKEKEKDGSSGKMVSEAISELKLQLDKCKLVNKDYISILEEKSAQVEMKWIQDLQGIYDNLSYEKSAIEDKHVGKSKVPRGDGGLKLERMKMPHFNGNVRDYARFKSDFLKQVMPEIGSIEKGAYALKSCLSSQAYAKVMNVDDDLKLMWQRLDDVYGRPSKIVDIVMYDIRKFKTFKDGEDKRFAEFVETIENGFLDLKRLNIEHEMSNSSSVAMIEEKLPPFIKRAWTLRVSKESLPTDETNKFCSLLEFLLEHKRAIEYEMMNIRAPSKQVQFQDQKEEKQVKTLQVASVKENRESDSIQDNDESDDQDDYWYENFRCWIHRSDTHPVWACRAYEEKSPEEKVELVRENNACWSCLRQGHKVSVCRYKRKCEIDNCKMFHHRTLHEADVIDNSNAHTSQNSTSGSNQTVAQVGLCLIQLMEIQSSLEDRRTVNVFWDSGAAISLITFEAAKRLGLRGKEKRVTVIKVGGIKDDLASFIYDLTLVDKDGKQVVFKVYGIDKITTAVKRIKLDGIIHLFRGLDGKEVERPEGEIDVLIGFEYAGFHPVQEQSSGHLLLLKNRFGRCLGGSHPELTENARKVVQGVVVNHAESISIGDFYEVEGIGVECHPRCGCCHCGRCAK